MNLRKITLALTIGVFTCMESNQQRQQRQIQILQLQQAQQQLEKKQQLKQKKQQNTENIVTQAGVCQTYPHRSFNAKYATTCEPSQYNNRNMIKFLLQCCVRISTAFLNIFGLKEKEFKEALEERRHALLNEGLMKSLLKYSLEHHIYKINDKLLAFPVFDFDFDQCDITKINPKFLALYRQVTQKNDSAITVTNKDGIIFEFVGYINKQQGEEQKRIQQELQQLELLQQEPQIQIQIQIMQIERLQLQQQKEQQKYEHQKEELEQKKQQLEQKKQQRQQQHTENIVTQAEMCQTYLYDSLNGKDVVICKPGEHNDSSLIKFLLHECVQISTAFLDILGLNKKELKEALEERRHALFNRGLAKLLLNDSKLKHYITNINDIFFAFPVFNFHFDSKNQHYITKINPKFLALYRQVTQKNDSDNDSDITVTNKDGIIFEFVGYINREQLKQQEEEQKRIQQQLQQELQQQEQQQQQLQIEQQLVQQQLQQEQQRQQQQLLLLPEHQLPPEQQLQLQQQVQLHKLQLQQKEQLHRIKLEQQRELHQLQLEHQHQLHQQQQQQQHQEHQEQKQKQKEREELEKMQKKINKKHEKLDGLKENFNQSEERLLELEKDIKKKQKEEEQDELCQDEDGNIELTKPEDFYKNMLFHHVRLCVLNKMKEILKKITKLYEEYNNLKDKYPQKQSLLEMNEYLSSLIEISKKIKKLKNLEKRYDDEFNVFKAEKLDEITLIQTRPLTSKQIFHLLGINIGPIIVRKKPNISQFIEKVEEILKKHEEFITSVVNTETKIKEIIEESDLNDNFKEEGFSLKLIGDRYVLCSSDSNKSYFKGDNPESDIEEIITEYGDKAKSVLAEIYQEIQYINSQISEEPEKIKKEVEAIEVKASDETPYLKTLIKCAYGDCNCISLWFLWKTQQIKKQTIEQVNKN